MRLDPRTAAITLAIVWLAVSALSAMVWWTRRRYGGFGHFAIAGPAIVLALLFLSLRHVAPDWVSVLAANAVLALASVLYLEGARAFRGRPARQWSVYAGGLVTIGDVPKNLSKDVGLCLFRVLQEALNNAVKHAGVQHVTVALREMSSVIYLTVEDRGVGFDPDATPQNQCLGIISMTERLNLVAGQIRIESRPGAGTTVHVRVPLDVERNVNARRALV